MISKQDKCSIKQMFDSISKDYDLMNNIMSLGMNPIIKKTSVLRINAKNPLKILDLCTGTGDIAINLAKKYPNAEIIAVDFSEKMLEIAKQRASGYKNISFMLLDITALPFDNNTFDVVTIGFGLRNLTDVKQALIEIKRVLKKDGIFSTLDLGKPNKFLNIIFKPYFFYIVPLLGKIIHRDKMPYDYLPKSNLDFPSQDEIINILQEIGFTEAKNYNYGFGTMAQQIAKG